MYATSVALDKLSAILAKKNIVMSKHQEDAVVALGNDTDKLSNKVRSLTLNPNRPISKPTLQRQVTSFENIDDPA